MQLHVMKVMELDYYRALPSPKMILHVRHRHSGLLSDEKLKKDYS